jgi:hypothetical protein
MPHSEDGAMSTCSCWIFPFEVDCSRARACAPCSWDIRWWIRSGHAGGAVAGAARGPQAGGANAILPGSRQQEIQRVLPPMLAAARELRRGAPTVFLDSQRPAPKSRR